MSLAIVYSRASMGVQAPLVTIEVHLSNGKPGFTLVGLPEKTVKEAQDRVRSALMNAQFKYPAKRITVNLAPADLPKEGGRFDLPIAIGILAASDQLDGSRLKQFEFVGELALTGELRGVHGVIPAILAAQKAKRAPIIAYQNANEASLVSEQETYFAKNLLEVVQFLNNQEKDALFLENALNKLGLSVRAYHRILKVSRTIADLNGEKEIQQPHLAEALGYRAMDRLLQKLSAA